MPATFNGLGIQFQYPDNWKLDDSDAMLGRKSVTVFSPGGAFWTVAAHSGTADPAKMAGAIVKTMLKVYEGLETEEVCETIAGHDLMGFDLSFFCLDLTNTAQIRGVHLANTTYTIFCQADDAEFKKVKMVFLAMSTSLINYLTAISETEPST
jgi:hypothetical protein